MALYTAFKGMLGKHLRKKMGTDVLTLGNCKRSLCALSALIPVTLGDHAVVLGTRRWADPMVGEWGHAWMKPKSHISH